MVLRTSELLEAILLSLDMRTLLTSAQMVSRRWHHMIQDSAPIQRALFLQADDKRMDDDLFYNPLLAEVFPMFFDFDGKGQINDLDIEELPIARRVGAMYRADASWRRMHVRQTPVRRVGIIRHHAIQWTRGLTLEMLNYPGGLRMEELYIWGLRHSYDHMGYVSWGEHQAPGFIIRDWPTATLRERAVDLVAMADVVFSSHIAGTCSEDDWDDRKQTDSNGLVTIGGEWFQYAPGEKSQLVWKEEEDRWD